MVIVFLGSFDKGADTEIYLIVLENGYLRMGQTPMVNGEGCLLFRCEQLSIRFLNPFLLPGFPGISHLYNLFRAKADERKPQYCLLLLNKG